MTRNGAMVRVRHRFAEGCTAVGMRRRRKCRWRGVIYSIGLSMFVIGCGALTS